MAAACLAQTETPIKDVMARIDPVTNQPKDTGVVVTVSGIIAAKLVLPDNQTIAFIHDPGGPALAVVAEAKSAARLVPRNQVRITGKLGLSPLGAALLSNPGGVTVTDTNQPFTSAPIAPDLFKDASEMAGRYTQLANVVFAAGKFDDSGKIKVKAPGGAEITLLVSKGVAGRETPAGTNDVFGVVVKSDGQWQMVAARFLPSNRRRAQEFATKYTCLTCHNPDKKIIGPPYREVAAKYRNDPDALAKLVAQMENGGSGKWGPAPMIPFKGKVPSGEMAQLGNWILGYRWDALLAE